MSQSDADSAKDWRDDEEVLELLDMTFGGDDMVDYLDYSKEEEISNELIASLDDLGYSPEELIPGVLLTAVTLAERTRNETAVLAEMVAYMESAYEELDDTDEDDDSDVLF